MVVDTAQGLAVQAAGTRVPLPEGAALQAGQPVELVLVEGTAGNQLHITPAPSQGPGTGVIPQGVAGAVSAFLRSLGLVPPSELPAAAQILPPGTPLTAETVRALLMLFTSRGGLGRDLMAIAALVNRAAAAGILPPDVADELADLIKGLVASDEKSFREAIEGFGRAAGKPLEARLAQWLAAGETGDLAASLKGDLAARLSSLRGQEALSRWLAGTGELGPFRDAVEGVLERLLGTHLQNARGLEHTYTFVEIPIIPGSPIESAQLHFFEEGNGAGRSFSGDQSFVVLDLQTTKLGDLWVSFRASHGTCDCHFRAMTEETVAAIQGAAAELEAGLRDAGYDRARVQVSLWDGNRLVRMAELMRRFSGIDLTA